MRFYKKSSNTPHVVWAEESNTGLGFEIGPSYDDVPTTSQCATEGQSSCNLRVFNYSILKNSTSIEICYKMQALKRSHHLLTVIQSFDPRERIGNKTKRIIMGYPSIHMYSAHILQSKSKLGFEHELNLLTTLWRISINLCHYARRHVLTPTIMVFLFKICYVHKTHKRA